MKQRDFYTSELNSLVNDYNDLSKYRKTVRGKILKSKLKLYLKEGKTQLAKKMLYVSLPFILTAISGYFIIEAIPTPKFIHTTIYKESPRNPEQGKMEDFLKKLSYFESRCNYNPQPANPSYHGKYQIGRAALITIGFNNIDERVFISEPQLQEVAIRRLLKFNKQQLASLIGKYQFKKIKGIYITESSILAASHLVGAGNAQKFLESNGTIDPVDGNGTSASKYMKEMSNFNLEF
jgi:hypothetical protein